MHSGNGAVAFCSENVLAKQALHDCRTGFATPSETFAFVDMQNIADGVANPVRQKDMQNIADGVANPVRQKDMQNIADGVANPVRQIMKTVKEKKLAT